MDVDRLLADFFAGTSDRCWVVAQLEESSDERVVSAFSRAIRDPAEDDLVRIEILKSLVMRRNDTAQRDRIGSAVMEVLRNRADDVLVRQFAAIAMRHYINCSGAVALLEKLVKDQTEDIDVRVNALAAIEAHPAMPVCREALERLAAIRMAL